MKPKGYLIFHLNLAFSSIEKHDWSIVIEKCYWPLLDIISDLQVPLGIELSGWTLNGIQETCPKWVDKFRQLLAEGKCELIGSGYCQIIAPLVPYEVNIQNQKIGLDIYQSLLGVNPKIALVNEMAFSDSVVDILAEVGFSAFVMDRDNIKLALGSPSQLPRFAKGVGLVNLPVLWADSILFQKLQHVSHGNISMDDYLDFVEKKISGGSQLLPLYSNDAETFDFRPGRFKEESKENPTGEWLTIRKVLENLRSELGFTFVLPSTAVGIQDLLPNKTSSSFTSARYPIPVKKQSKYNIARWAVTGRDDTWLNTMCFRIYNKLVNSTDFDHKSWKNLCELWASDLRTHLTEKRWVETKLKINKTLSDKGISDFYQLPQETSLIYDLQESATVLGKFQRRIFGDGIYLELKSEKTTLLLNLRRGLTIESLAFAGHGFDSCMGKLPHGYNESISQGVDYYSGGVIIEIPGLLTKITDLNPVTPEYSVSADGDLTVKVVIDTSIGQIIKIIEISSSAERIKISYKFRKIKRYIASVRIGNFTLSPEFSRSFRSYSFHAGGSNQGTYIVDGDLEQSSSASRFVSSSRGFFSSSGSLSLNCGVNSLDFSWDNAMCSPLCLLDHSKNMTRLSYSVCEFDETSKESNKLGEICLVISPGASND